MNARRGAPAVHRVPALVAVAAIVVGLVAADHAGRAFAPSIRAAPQPVSGPSVPPADTISSTWLCAEGTSSPTGRADETVIIANLAPRPVTATVTVLAGSDQRAANRQVRVDALGQRRVNVGTVLVTAEPGVVVEVPSGAAVVEHELRRGNNTTIGPCARQASADWYFAAGNTGLGAEDWLALFNPFGDDAIVDLTFLTPSGVQAPGNAQALVVPRRSRISVPVHTIVRSQDQLAIHIHARTGRLVAEQTLLFDGTNGRSGLATALGATGFASRWRIPAADAQAGAKGSVVIANFQNRGTRVAVDVTLDGNRSLPPQTIAVPSMGVVAVDLGARVPPGGGYSVTVHTTRPDPVVVELAEQWSPPAPVSGSSTTLGSTVVASRWAFAAGVLDTPGNAQLVAYNVSGRPLTVELRAYTAGNVNSPQSAPAQALGVGQRVAFDLGANAVGPGQVLVLSADGPIVAGRLVLAPSPSLSVGFPELG